MSLIIHLNNCEEIADKFQILFLVQADASPLKVICCCINLYIIVVSFVILLGQKAESAEPTPPTLILAASWT